MPRLLDPEYDDLPEDIADDSAEPDYDWDDHPSLTAAERNPGLR